jgi:hypothetical protein
LRAGAISYPPLEGRGIAYGFLRDIARRGDLDSEDVS